MNTADQLQEQYLGTTSQILNLISQPGVNQQVIAALQKHQNNQHEEAVSEYRNVMQSLVKSNAPVSDRACIYYLMYGPLRALNRLSEAVLALEAAYAYAPDLKNACEVLIANIEPQAKQQDSLLRFGRESANMLKAYLRFPFWVQIETMATCNANCCFCPYSEIPRQGTKMSDALIDKLITDLGDIPKDHKFGLSFHHISEVFVDKRVFELFERVTTELPNAELSVVSNGSTLTEKIMTKLEQFNAIPSMQISFNDHREGPYQTSMKLPYKRTLENLDRLHKSVSEGRLSTIVTIRRVGDGSSADKEFIEFCNNRWPSFDATSKPVKDFLGQIEKGPEGLPLTDSQSFDIPIAGCPQWYQLVVMADGNIATCCFDGKGEWPVGDASKAHLLDIYNSPFYRRFREFSYTRIEAPSPCDQCTIHWG